MEHFYTLISISLNSCSLTSPLYVLLKHIFDSPFLLLLRPVKIDMDIFNGVPAVEAEQLPFNIDSLCCYVLPCKREALMASSKDGRPWKPWCTSKRAGHKGVRRRAVCKGSWRCNNKSCPFLKEKNSPNTVQFVAKSGKKVCLICENEATLVQCSAVKIWEFSQDQTSVSIYHCGFHRCTAIPRKQNRELENKLQEAFIENNTLKPSEASGNLLVSELKGEDWDEIERVAETVADSKRISSLKEKAKTLGSNGLGHSFDALSNFKSFCDKRDACYIYKMNNHELNGEMTYVFKCSSIQAQLALSMEYNGDGILNDQYCFADAKHDRCTGFKTLTLWVFHPVMRKLVKLATMESAKEDSKAVAMFWNLLNEVNT